jgi:hypothetical protein
MKYVILAMGFAVALAASQFTMPAEAQGNVQQLCRNKHGLGPKQHATASEERRREAAAKIAACIRSGGKS